MQIIAQSPLVLQLTQNSGIALGIISLAQASPFLIFSFVGGGVADRVDKRRLLLVTQGPQIVYAFVLGILTVTGLVQFWHIVVLSMLVGVTLSFDQPTRFALIPSLVARFLMRLSPIVISRSGSLFRPIRGGSTNTYPRPRTNDWGQPHEKKCYK